jgi:hypothetical protein
MDSGGAGEIRASLIRSRVWKAGQTFKFALLPQSPRYVTRDNSCSGWVLLEIR